MNTSTSHEAPAQFVEEEIKQLSISIWDTMLHLPLEPSDVFQEIEPGMLAACVQITGAWEGAVSLTCGAPLAAHAAGIMFGLGDAEATTLDMQDALGELANMVGGNIKALLPETCHLSLPMVVAGPDYTARVLNSRIVTRVAMTCMEWPLDIALLQKIKRAA